MKYILIISFIHFHYNFGEDGDYSNMKLKTYEKDLVNKKTNRFIYYLVNIYYSLYMYHIIA